MRRFPEAGWVFAKRWSGLPRRLTRAAFDRQDNDKPGKPHRYVIDHTNNRGWSGDVITRYLEVTKNKKRKGEGESNKT